MTVKAALEAQQAGKTQENGLIQRNEGRHRHPRAQAVKPQAMRAIGVVHNAMALAAAFRAQQRRQVGKSLEAMSATEAVRCRNEDNRRG